MPVDDTCMKCVLGTVRLVKLPERQERERLKQKAARFALHYYARRRTAQP